MVCWRGYRIGKLDCLKLIRILFLGVLVFYCFFRGNCMLGFIWEEIFFLCREGLVVVFSDFLDKFKEVVLILI